MLFMNPLKLEKKFNYKMNIEDGAQQDEKLQRRTLIIKLSYFRNVYIILLKLLVFCESLNTCVPDSRECDS